MSNPTVIEKLREVRQKYAAEVALRATEICTALEHLERIEDSIHEEAVAIAGENYYTEHMVAYEPFRSVPIEHMQEQRHVGQVRFWEMKVTAEDVLEAAEIVMGGDSTLPSEHCVQSDASTDVGDECEGYDEDDDDDV